MKETLYYNILKKRNERQGNALKNRYAIGLLFIASLFLFSCSSQRVATTGEQGKRIEDEEQGIKEEQEVRTVYVPSARVSLTIDGEMMSSRVAFMTTMDSLVIWSIQPMVGFEVIRVEATPTDLVVFDKTSMEYIPLTYESLLPYSSTPITYKEIQDIATGAILPRGQEKTLRAFSVANMTIILDITYPQIRTNVPVNMNRLPMDRFTYKSLDQVFQ